MYIGLLIIVSFYSRLFISCVVDIQKRGNFVAYEAVVSGRTTLQYSMSVCQSAHAVALDMMTTPQMFPS